MARPSPALVVSALALIAAAAAYTRPAPPAPMPVTQPAYAAAAGNIDAAGDGLPLPANRLRDSQVVPVVNVRAYGATGDGATDDTAAIAAAVAACPAHGTVYFPRPAVGYLVRGSGTECLLVAKNVSLVGEHGDGVRLIVADDVPDARDVIRIAVPGPCFFQRVERLRIESADGTTPRGRHALRVDVRTAGAYQSNMLIEGNRFGPTTGYSVYFDNDNGAGSYANLDGWFCSQIKRNLILSGMSLLNFGDSNVIGENTFGHVGPVYLGTYRTAILMTQVPGAARCIIRDNNNSAFGGFVRAINCAQLVIEGNQAEQGNTVDPSVQPESAVVALINCGNPRVVGNNFSPHGPLGRANWGVHLDGCSDATVAGNTISPGVAGTVNVTATCVRTRVGDNATDETLVADAGLRSARDGAWQRVHVAVVSGATTLTAHHVGRTVYCAPASPAADYTVTLPPASAQLHRTLTVVVPPANARLVTVTTGGGGTIDGAAERVLWANESCVLWSDGTDWHKVAGRTVPMVCRLTRAAPLSVNTATVTKVGMDAVERDNTGLMADLPQGRIACRRAGLYRCEARVTYAALGTATIVQARLHVNADARAYDIRDVAGASGYPSPAVGLTTALTAGDLVYAYTFQTSGADGALYFEATPTQYLEATEVPQW